ncbi:unnamed protein product [Anisakis simplex]|uniref:Uncharacterized protein n=1 Tax=Anisakis simplex TaxID=6269 RepID=A0A3P6N0W4_ANISI|nr:unnamed protein product [Anisakis simplex]
MLDETDETIALLTDGTNFVGVNDTSKTSEVLELPEGLECTRCALRLVRQATEHGREFEFYSCADVNIVESERDCKSTFDSIQKYFNISEMSQ